MADPLYVSLTRKVPLAGLPAPLLAAVEKHAATASLALADAPAWCTHRTNPPSTSFFGKLFGKRANSVDPDTEHEMVLVLHRTHVLVGTHGASRGTAILSLALANATVTRGSRIATAFAANLDVPNDDGITIVGFAGTEGRPGSYFFGMGGPEADPCFASLSEAVHRAKNP